MNTPETGFVGALFALAEQVEYSTVGTWIGSSRFAYPVIEGIHLIGLVVAVGTLFVIDLRLLGVLLRQVPLSRLLRQLHPWILWGFGVIYLTGALLLWSEASRMLDSPAFVLKLVLLLIGTVNALYFELVLSRSPAIREDHAVLPARIRAVGAISLTTWTLVIVLGRMTAYLPHWSLLAAS